MKKVLTLILLLVISACGKEGDRRDVDSATGADSSKITVPNWTKIFPPRPDATTPSTATPGVSTGKTEQCTYSGRYNGDRATWYCSKKMSSYPDGLRVVVDGCYNVTISDTGKRYEKSGLIVKQSDVSGRGLAIVTALSCKSKTAHVEY